MGRDDTWETVTLTANALGMTARERFERFKLEAISEMALRLAGGLMVAGSTMLWLVLPVGDGSGQVVSHGVLAAMFGATGLFVYAFGTRGFRRQLSLDAKRKTLTLTKININEQGRVMRTVPLDRVQSMFLRRPAAPGAQAALYVRANGGEHPILALTGDKSELEVVHRDLCDCIQRISGRSRDEVTPAAPQPEFARRLKTIRA